MLWFLLIFNLLGSICSLLCIVGGLVTVAGFFFLSQLRFLLFLVEVEEGLRRSDLCPGVLLLGNVPCRPHLINPVVCSVLWLALVDAVKRGVYISDMWRQE
jgi:hypothetical protein